MTSTSSLPTPAKERPELVEAWTKTRDHPPPKGFSTRLLRLACTYDRQVTEHGGLSKSSLRKLLNYANRYRGNKPPSDRKQPTARPSTGTRLVREWQGQSHVVDVLNNKILYQGQSYRSLSEVARLITGARWSGPRFFGL
ncbi:MAG: DUF2924 domain-containing protein [Alphaproteobacteria bacterium]|jgi:hypothetical protein|nr:DUF2924 domain-containing protein [Alphaproteobacteria bacterium]